MIQESAIDQAIIECQAEKDPNAWTMMRLAAHYIVKHYMFSGEDNAPPPEALKALAGGLSFAAGPPMPQDEIVRYSGKTDFARRIANRPAADIWPILDELMTIIRTLYPELYTEVLKKLPE